MDRRCPACDVLEPTRPFHRYQSACMCDPPTGDLVDRPDVFGRKLGVLRTPRTSQSLPMPLGQSESSHCFFFKDLLAVQKGSEENAACQIRELNPSRSLRSEGRESYLRVVGNCGRHESFVIWRCLHLWLCGIVSPTLYGGCGGRKGS